MQSAQVIACSKLITLHLLQSRQPTNIYSPHKGIVNCVHINHTNKVIASCGQDGRIVLVNAQKPDNQVFQTSFHSGSSSIKPASVNTIMFSSHSHYIAAGSSDCLVKIWDMKNHKHVYSTIKSHVGSVSSIAWIKSLGTEKAQGEIISSASSIGDIYLHSVKTGNIVETLHTRNQEGINQIKVSQSQGHSRLAACTSLGSVMVWNLRNLQKDTRQICYFNNGKKSSITSVSFSSFNPVLLATSSVDQTLTFYDVNQKKSVKVITSQQPLTSINFHSDGHTLIAGGMYGSLFIYDLRKPSKPREKLTGHDSAIKHTVFIKEHEPLSSTLTTSRSSKSSSVNSFNSSKVPSGKSIKQSEETKQVEMNNFVQPMQRRTQTSGPNRQGKIRQKIESIQNKKQPIKLSVTGQQAIKNSQNRSSGFGKTNPILTVPGGYNYYNKSQQSNLGTGNNSKDYPKSIPKNNIVQMDPSPVTLLQQKPVLLNPSKPTESASITQLKEFIDERFQTIHMQLIHQFHLQQTQMKEMIVTMLVQDRKKNQKIKQLESQIKQLKGNTY